MPFITQVDFTRQVRQRAGEIHTLSGSTNILGNLDVQGAIMSGGTNLLDIFAGGTNSYVTAGVYNGGTTSIDYTGNAGFPPFSVDVSALLDDTNTYVTGGTLTNDYDLVLLHNNGTSASTISLSALSDNVIVQYVNDLDDLLDAFALFTGTSTGGIIKMGSNISLSSDLTLDFDQGIELWGGGNAFTMNGNIMTVKGSRATFRNVAFVGDVNFNTGTGPNYEDVNSQNIIKIDDSSLSLVKFVECRMNDVVGGSAGSFSADTYYPIIIENCANWSTFELLYHSIGTRHDGGSEKPYGPFGVKWNESGTDGTRLMFKDWYNNSPEQEAEASRFIHYKDSMVIKIDGGFTDFQNQIVYDQSVTIDPTSTFGSATKPLDLYSTSWGPVVTQYAQDPTVTSTFGYAGDIQITGDSAYMKVGTTTEGGDTDWIKLGSDLWSEGTGSEIYYNAGNIGIGTNNPAHPLHISGNSGNLEVKVENAGGNSFLTLESSSTSNSYVDYEDAGGDRWIVGNHSNGTENFFKWSTTSSFAGTVLTLDRDGQLGLGDQTPAAKLHVVGLGATSGTDAVTVEDSGFNTLFHVRDDGYVGIGTNLSLIHI